MKKNIYFLLMLLAGFVMSSCSEEDVVFDSELPQFELRADKVLLEVLVPGSTLAEDQLYICGDWNKTEDGYAQDEMWQLTRSTSAPGRAEYKWGIYLDPSVNLAAGYHFFSQKEGVERTVFNTDSIHTLNPGVGNRANVVVNRWESFFKSQEEEPIVEHDGYAIFILNESSEKDLALYAWGDAEAFGGWPGVQPTGTQRINGVEYTYFDAGEANSGLALHLIPNNNNGGVQWEGDALFVTLDHDVFIRIADGGVYEMLDAPSPVIKHDGYAVFVENKTTWEDPVSLYMWGDENNLGGEWPGMSATGTQTIDGVEYIYFDLGEQNEGLNENLIFNNTGNGKQLPDFNFTIERDLYLVITDNGVTEKGSEPAPEPEPAAKQKFYLKNDAGWEKAYVYAWNADGAPEICGGWPGREFSGKETVDGVEYIVAEFDKSDAEYHFIINNGNGTQFDDVVVGPANTDYRKTLTAEGVNSRRRVRK